MEGAEEIREKVSLQREAIMFNGQPLPVWTGARETLYGLAKKGMGVMDYTTICNIMLYFLTHTVAQGEAFLNGKKPEDVFSALLEWSDQFEQLALVEVHGKMMDIRNEINAVMVKVSATKQGRAAEKKTEPIPAS